MCDPTYCRVGHVTLMSTIEDRYDNYNTGWGGISPPAAGGIFPPLRQPTISSPTVNPRPLNIELLHLLLLGVGSVTKTLQRSYFFFVAFFAAFFFAAIEVLTSFPYQGL